MAPRKSSAGYNGVRRRPSGNYGLEFQHAGRRYWLGTFPSADIAARAYDVTMWRLGLPRSKLNFPKIETRADAEHVGPPMTIESSPIRAPRIVIDERDNFRETDEEAMAAFARAHPEYVQAEREFYWKKEAEKRKNDHETGPSSSQSKKRKNGGGGNVIDVNSDDLSNGIDWDNL